jgi:hypothetical protein
MNSALCMLVKVVFISGHCMEDLRHWFPCVVPDYSSTGMKNKVALMAGPIGKEAWVSCLLLASSACHCLVKPTHSTACLMSEQQPPVPCTPGTVS